LLRGLGLPDRTLERAPGDHARRSAVAQSTAVAVFVDRFRSNQFRVRPDFQ